MISFENQDLYTYHQEEQFMTIPTGCNLDLDSMQMFLTTSEMNVK